MYVVSRLFQNISFQGHIPREKVKEILSNNKRIFFLLELNPPCPNSLIEAISVGLPCIGFDTGSFKELLGGAGKSILKELGLAKNTYIANRSENKVELAIQNDNLKKYSGEPVHLFISCAEKFDLESLNFIENINLDTNGRIYDINYKSETNIVLSEMEIVDENRLYDGLGMLVEQAADSFEHWFEHRPNTEHRTAVGRCCLCRCPLSVLATAVVCCSYLLLH